MVTTTGGNCIGATRGSNIISQDMEFGACAAAHISVSNGAHVDMSGSYSISGTGAAEHVFIASGATFNVTSGTVTIADTPAFSSAFARIEGPTYARISPTWSNAAAATGVRTIVKNNSVLDLNGTAQNLLPGNSDGTPSAGGLIV
jgi:hypothetical protein